MRKYDLPTVDKKVTLYVCYGKCKMTTDVPSFFHFGFLLQFVIVEGEIVYRNVKDEE